MGMNISPSMEKAATLIQNPAGCRLAPTSPPSLEQYAANAERFVTIKTVITPMTIAHNIAFTGR